MDKSILGLLLILESATAVSYYCNRNGAELISGIETGVIRTVYEGSGTYEPSMSCEWVIDAGEGSLIALNVTESRLTYAPPDAICSGYDYIEVQNGQGPSDKRQPRPGEHVEDSAVIVNWCGNDYPRYIHSTDRYIYVKFASDDRPYAAFSGVTLHFTVFNMSLSHGGCPPGWSDQVLEPAGGDTCFTVSSEKRDWIDAHAHCNYMQANLAALDSAQQADFVTELVSQQSKIKPYENVWLGLNDVAVTGQYRWLNGSLNQDFFRWRHTPHKPDGFLHCVCMQYGDGLWKVDFCNINNIRTVIKYYYVCEKKKGLTELYRIPEKISKNRENSGISIPVKGVLISGGVLIILVIGAVTMYYYYRKQRSANARDSAQVTYRQSASVTQPHTRRPEAEPMARRYTEQSSDHPPSYDEAMSLK